MSAGGGPWWLQPEDPDTFMRKHFWILVAAIFVIVPAAVIGWGELYVISGIPVNWTVGWIIGGILLAQALAVAAVARWRFLRRTRSTE